MRYYKMNITSEMFDGVNAKEVNPPRELIEAEAAVIAGFFYEKKKYKETDVTKRVILEIADIKARTRGIDFSPAKKGVGLVGSVGTGKTMALKLAAYYLDAEFFDVSHLAIEFSQTGPKGFWGCVERKYGHKDFIVDDLGAELETNNFGNKFPIVELIYRRYNVWKVSGSRFWFSSNLTWAEIERRYGVRCTDRLKEMCVLIPAVGDSFRGR
jgi:DNA replication protein DnaC